MGITRVAVGAAVEGVLAARTPAEETIDVRATEPAGLGRAGVDGARPDGAGLDPAGLDRAGLDRARAGAREEGFVAVADISKAGPARKEGFVDFADISKAGPSSPIRGGPSTEDHGEIHARGPCRGMEHEAQVGGGSVVQRRQGAPKDGPEPGMQQHPGAEAQARHFSREAASLPRGQATTMASAATVLLARVVAVEKRDHLSAGSPASQVCAEEEEEEPVARETGAREQPSPRMRHGLEVNLSGKSGVGAGAERKGRALSAASGEGELRRGEGGVLSTEDEWRRPVGVVARLSPSGPTGLQGSSRTQETTPVMLLTGEGGAALGSSRSIRAKSRSVGNAPEALRSPSRRGHVRTSPAPTGSAWAERPDAAAAEVEGPIASVDRTKKLTRLMLSARSQDRSPAATRQNDARQLSAPARDRSPAAVRQSDSRKGVTGGDASDVGSAGGGRTGVTEGEGRPEVGGVGERRRSSEDATEHLLREASRVKGLLAAMDRADSASTPGDDGLRDEDPGRFLGSLGLVELKPLAGRLAEALERTPQALLCDPAVPVPEPRTARGLRDQVACAHACCG